MSDEPLITFKEMCARFDTTPRTLRYYEYIELLDPHRDGRARFYGPREIARMTLILRGRRWGFSLEQIRQWLLIHDTEGSQEQFRVLVELADEQLTKLATEISDLQTARQELQTMRNEVAEHLEKQPAS